MSKFLKGIAESGWFQNLVRLVILLAGVLIGLETSSAVVAQIGEPLGIINRIILVLFGVEILIKMGAEGWKPWRYFYDPWNVFDFIIVGMALLPFDAEYIAVLRLARLFRFLRLVRAVPKLQILVSALLKSIPSMVYVAILLAMLFYMYAVFGVFIFGPNDPVHFGNLPIAMLSLFRVVTGEDWTDVMYIQMYGCSGYGYGDWASLCTQPEAFPLLSPAFFVTFMLFGSLIVLNLFIGVIMNSMDESKAEREALERIERAEAQNLTFEDELEEITASLGDIQDHVRGLQVRMRTGLAVRPPGRVPKTKAKKEKGE